MDQTVDQIEAQIDQTRERLGSNLKELERKVDAATDWRKQFSARPYLMLGGACLGGALLAATLRPRTARRSASLEAALAGPRPVARRGFDGRGQIVDLWDNVATALLGVASASVKDYIAGMVPGFDEQYSRAAQRPAPR